MVILDAQEWTRKENRCNKWTVAGSFPAHDATNLDLNTFSIFRPRFLQIRALRNSKFTAGHGGHMEPFPLGSGVGSAAGFQVVGPWRAGQCSSQASTQGRTF
jgi:hypothetical protein